MQPFEKWQAHKSQYIIPMKQLHEIKDAFIKDMEIGLKTNGLKSSTRMLLSKVFSTPTGNEKGIFYAIDFGGSNYRVIRMQLFGHNKTPKINSITHKIPNKYKTTSNAEELFDYLSLLFLNFMKTFNEHNKNRYFDVGFTFSFGMNKTAINEGYLLEWDKGYMIPNVVGKDIVKLMNKSLHKLNIPAVIKTVCNDTVGALLSCSYSYSDCKISVVVGTGTNAAYIEPARNNEIINIEWGYFDDLLPRIKDTDILMDSYTTNCGSEFAEKMISGMYISEIIRLLFLSVFQTTLIINKVKKSIMFQQFGEFNSYEVSQILNNYYNNDINGILKRICSEKYNLYWMNENDAKIFGEICELIVNRSADLVSALLLGILQKISFYEFNSVSKKYRLCKKNDNITVGIDGSVYWKMPLYKTRLKQTMKKLVGNNIVKHVNIVHAKDGSGIGAALCAATCTNVSSSKL